MNSEKIHFFEKHLLFTVQSNNGKTVSFRLDTSKLIRILFFCLTGVLLLSLGTLLFFKERADNRILSQKLLTYQVAPTVLTTMNRESGVKKSITNARIQEFSGNCHLESCSANLILASQENQPAEGSLIILLETITPQIGAGNPTAKSRQKYYAYPEQKIKESLNPEEIFQLETKPYHISRSLTSRADFTIGQFQRPVAFHLYLFNPAHELIKHERVPVITEDKNDP